jgi:3-dehydroquinate synthase
VIGRGILKELKLPGKVIVVADFRVANLYQIQCDHRIQVPNLKTKENYESILEELFKLGCDRQTTLVGLGGGTICDLVGYVASTFMRGIPLIFIPTTLLAMVDASIGGKTAIDTHLGKNLIGSLYFPKMIYVDLDVLSSLPETELQNGMAEILKMGLIQDPSLFVDYHEDLVEKAILAKIQVVEKDPVETGLRRILNFGHTIGHGLERIGDCIPHGKAVALGSLAESFLSMDLGFLSESSFKQIQNRYQKFHLTLPEGYSREALFQKMRYDKKSKDGFLRFVLVDQIGHAIPFEGEYCTRISESKLNKALEWLESNYI